MATDETRKGSGVIIKEDIVLPFDPNKLAFVLHNVFTKEECQQYIEDTEKKGYEPALINSFGRQTLRTDIRKSGRCMIDSPSEANQIFSRIKDFIPAEWNSRKVVGLNERLRFLRYDPGDYFRPHYDGIYVRDNGEECSYITVHLYLNEGFQGGATTFINHYDVENGSVQCVPKTGSVLIFEHDILHEGSELLRGRKYTLRTDVMYSAKRNDC